MSFNSIHVFKNLRPLLDSVIRTQDGDPFDIFPFSLQIPKINISSSLLVSY